MRLVVLLLLAAVAAASTAPLFAWSDGPVFNKINREAPAAVAGADAVACLGRNGAPACHEAVPVLTRAAVATAADARRQHRFVFVLSSLRLDRVSQLVGGYGPGRHVAPAGSLFAALPAVMEGAKSAVTLPYSAPSTVSEIEEAAARLAADEGVPLVRGLPASFGEPAVYLVFVDEADASAALIDSLPASHAAVLLAPVDAGDASLGARTVLQTDDDDDDVPTPIDRNELFIWRDYFTPGAVEGLLAALLVSSIAVSALSCVMQVQVPAKFETAVKYSDAAKKTQ